jgi:hypothetical protein
VSSDDNLADTDTTSPSDDETLRAALLRIYPPPALFAVVSWGCAATTWIARTLNSHPDILCMHEGAVRLARIGRQPVMSATEYLSAIGSIASFHKAAGDVHGIALQSLPELRAALPRFRAAVVVREPIARFLSHIAMVDQWAPARIWNLAHIDAVCAENGLPPPTTYRERLWMHAAQSLNAIVDEKNERVYRAEDLTSSADSLVDFVSYLTSDDVHDANWATAAVQRSPTNRHGNALAKTLLPTQAEILRAIVAPDAWALYENLGYSAHRSALPA